MSEAVYEQVERAIRLELHVRGRYQMPLDGPSYEYPVAIEHGNIILRDGDCGLAKDTREITTDEWAELAGQGLFRQVGMWSFVEDDAPAAKAIAYCHSYPHAAGHELHELRCASASTSCA